MITLPSTPDFSLEGKKALVVGASSGIGLGAAVALARAGADVTCAARRTDKTDALVESLHLENKRASSCYLDVACVEEMQKILSGLPPFDVVVNAAGLARHAPALSVSLEDYNAVLDINLRGAFFLSQFTAQRMIDEQIKGSIIHISSQMGHVGGQLRSVYCAAKHGMEGMIKAFAIEWGKHNIRVNSIAPTFVYTELTQQTLDDPKLSSWVKENIQLTRYAEVSDIAGAVLFLAGEMSLMVTGTSILVDGGWTAA